MIVRQIRALLYDQGYTIGGARQQFNDPGTGSTKLQSHQQVVISQLISDLEEVLSLLNEK